jgi:hypothetical protein
MRIFLGTKATDIPRNLVRPIEQLLFLSLAKKMTQNETNIDRKGVLDVT